MRAFSLIEIMIVGAIVAVLATGAVVAASSAAERHRIRTQSNRVLDDIARQRAAHVAEARSELMVICADCVDARGEPHAPSNPNELDFYLADSADPARGRIIASTTYDITIAEAGCERVALDSLGRSVLAGSTPTAFVDAALKLNVQADVPEQIVFGGNGSLTSTFAPPIPAAPPHANNLSARTTPVPMDRGTFQGDPQRALALPLH